MYGDEDRDKKVKTAMYLRIRVPKDLENKTKLKNNIKTEIKTQTEMNR